MRKDIKNDIVDKEYDRKISRQENRREIKMSIPMQNKRDVVYNKEDDPMYNEIGLKESIDEEDKKIEDGPHDGSHDAEANNEESIDDIRTKIVDFIKSQGYSYAEGEREFDDETNDLFTKGGTLIELAITVGIDKEVINQIADK